MELFVLLELLKYLFIAYELVTQHRAWKREKAVIATLESYDQRLKLLENELRLKS